MLNHFLVSYSDQPYSKVREKSSMCSKIIECTFSISHSICSQLCMLMCSSMYSLLFHSQFDIACLSYRHERDRICSRIENISCYNRDWLHRTTGQRHRQTKRIRIDFNFFSLTRSHSLSCTRLSIRHCSTQSFFVYLVDAVVAHAIATKYRLYVYVFSRLFPMC